MAIPDDGRVRVIRDGLSKGRHTMLIRAEAIALPHPALPNANWVDRYSVQLEGQAMTAKAAAQRIFARPPEWAQWLMVLRNAIVSLVGLKNAGRMEGETGGFPVVSESENEIVLGFDDWHLDFRIVVDITPTQTGQSLSVSTLVDRHNLAGRIYIFFVTPFHHRIVRSMLKAVARPA